MAQFSARTGWNLHSTPYAAALVRLRSSGADFIDLTASNPTVCGFVYDNAGILAAFQSAGMLEYDPDPRGMLPARNAVAQYYAETANTEIDSNRIFLTTSTSEAYSYLFRLHCDPGSEILIAQPGYPLFEFLADLDDVKLVSYPLFYDHGWHLDRAALRDRLTPRTRAIAVVHPNNPTGHYISSEERQALEKLCLKHDLALIVDEVFFDYSLNSMPSVPVPPSFASGDHPVLTYVLSGLSKVAGLPQMKASWIVASGPPALLNEAMARLEVIADTFLSTNAPVQHAVPFLLRNRYELQRQILERVQTNLTALDLRLRSAPALSRLQVQGGWYAILRVPALLDGEKMAIGFMEDQHVLVQPGYFFGMQDDGWIVVSLLTPSAQFSEGIDRLVRCFS